MWDEKRSVKGGEKCELSWVNWRCEWDGCWWWWWYYVMSGHMICTCYLFFNFQFILICLRYEWCKFWCWMDVSMMIPLVGSRHFSLTHFVSFFSFHFNSLYVWMSWCMYVKHVCDVKFMSILFQSSFSYFIFFQFFHFGLMMYGWCRVIWWRWYDAEWHGWEGMMKMNI